MTFRHHTPAGIRAPFARYSHGVEVPPGTRLLFCSGQVGVTPDDSIPDSVEAQTDLCFANITAILGEAGMGPANVLRLNAYVTDRSNLAGYMAARDRFCADIDPPPASTLMIVSGFARPELKVEVEAVAAAPAR
ncbi:MAG: RidA family protein [Aestuariivirgaceae bacterium]